jgi:regulator of protease activity HflC (stomatin/prohibitin superfamily)
MAEQRVTVQIQGCVQANEAEIRQAVENALANLIALVELDDLEFSGPEDMAQVAEQMIRASMDRMGIEDVVGLTVTCVGAD